LFRFDYRGAWSFRRFDRVFDAITGEMIRAIKATPDRAARMKKEQIAAKAQRKETIPRSGRKVTFVPSRHARRVMNPVKRPDAARFRGVFAAARRS